MQENQAIELNEQIQSLMNQGKWLDAIELVQKDVELLQNSYQLSWNIGWCFFKLDRNKEARKHLLQACKLNPGSAVSHWAIGTIYLKLGQYKMAEASLKKALRIKDSHLARSALAFTYHTQGNIDEAERIHLEGLKLKQDDWNRYKSYACFLSDVGREEEAQQMNRKARNQKRGKKQS